MNQPTIQQHGQPLNKAAQSSGNSGALRFIIRTPKQIVVDTEVESARVSTQSGQVGLRPRGEPGVLAVDAGLILLKDKFGTRYAGTAGGLLHSDRRSASLLTPLAVVGDDIESVAQKLDALLAEPSEEMEVRRAMGRLETRILQELKQSDPLASKDLGRR